MLGFHSDLGLLDDPSYVKGNPIKPSPSHQLLFSSDQADAFALFQAISAQVQYRERIFLEKLVKRPQHLYISSGIQ